VSCPSSRPGPIAAGPRSTPAAWTRLLSREAHTRTYAIHIAALGSHCARRRGRRAVRDGNASLWPSMDKLWLGCTQVATGWLVSIARWCRRGSQARPRGGDEARLACYTLWSACLPTAPHRCPARDASPVVLTQVCCTTASSEFPPCRNVPACDDHILRLRLLVQANKRTSLPVAHLTVAHRMFRPQALQAINISHARAWPQQSAQTVCSRMVQALHARKASVSRCCEPLWTSKALRQRGALGSSDAGGCSRRGCNQRKASSSLLRNNVAISFCSFNSATSTGVLPSSFLSVRPAALRAACRLSACFPVQGQAGARCG
jgi:hypothetical protein